MIRGKTGVARLPLHTGRAPRWLFQRMTYLAREVGVVICTERGVREFMRKLSDPFWFQAFGCVLGFDWHSSGLTTTVCGALKQGLKDAGPELGIFVCGGKGGTSRKTPGEIRELADARRIRADAQPLIYSSRMSAKVDNTALQDGYQLYHHNFICDRGGNWIVIQQGMNEMTGWARRYHWSSEHVKDFVVEPHQSVCCDHRGQVLNMTARESGAARQRSAHLSQTKPEKVVKEYSRIREFTVKRHHDVRINEIQPKNLHKILLSTYEQRIRNFEELLGVPGVGPKTVRALALISELIYGERVSFRDPVRFSFAHGGKDGHPYPVNREVYDRSIAFLRDAVSKTKLGRSEKLKALKRLKAHQYE
ncbi:MAG: DUF763 domain-containing protein [Candidatus Omnitrophica bacterium]|nr:DUF763 domain-containing protein [Candidatus Omnitrophota bacterium]